jgi:hypothetical protein
MIARLTLELFLDGGGPFRLFGVGRLFFEHAYSHGIPPTVVGTI